MKKFLCILAIVAFSAMVGSTAEAKGPGPKLGAAKPITQSAGLASNKGISTAISGQGQIKSVGQQIGGMGNNKLGQTFKTTSGKTIAYQSCPQHLRSCCYHSSFCNWSNFCWFGNYGCHGCYCPVRCCWYYWYEPYCCYLPCTYIQTYCPVQVVQPVAQTTYATTPIVNVNTNTNTNVNQNGAPVGGIPAGVGQVGGQSPDVLPPGATPVSQGFSPKR